MKALMYKSYGPPDRLSFNEIPMTEPQENEIRIKTESVSLNAYDWHLLTAEFPVVRFSAGLFKPKVQILGADIAGTVEKIGRNVTEFKSGDTVFGDLAMSGIGGLSEFVTAPASRFNLIPPGLNHDEAAALPMAAITALQAIKNRGSISKGDKIVINGAAGGVGTFAIQIAKAYSAEVTAVCSEKNHEQAKNLGADFVIDYKKEDFTKNGKKYDIILAINGYHPIKDYYNSLAENGRYIAIGGTSKQIAQAFMRGPGLSRKNGKKLGAFISQPNPSDVQEMIQLVTEKKIKPIIDKRFSFDESIEAFRYLGGGHARGKIIINM